MFKKDRPSKRVRTIAFWGGLFLFTVILQVLARMMPGFAEGYAVTMYPVLVRVIGGISNLVPFALDELCIYIMTISAAVYLITGICRMRKKLVPTKVWFCRTAGGISKILILWFLIFTMNCGVNYHRTPFSVLARLPMEKSAVDELEGLCRWLTDEIEEVADVIVTKENGVCALPDDMLTKTQEAMMHLGELYPQLSGWYPKAKPVFTWPVLSYESLEGIAGPYTMEAHYNPNIPAHNQPAVICHELSHLKGFMREDEANYIAYLACVNAEDVNLRYSGLLLAYTHGINALYRADYDRFTEVRSQLCGQAERDYAYHSLYWDQFEGPVAEISDKVNDVYLKANAQKEGSRSYGRMVDLLLGEYRQRISAE